MPTIALLSWPVVALALTSSLTRLNAVIALIIVPYLLLPERTNIALPGLPDLDKTSIISFSLVLAFFLIRRKPNDPDTTTRSSKGSRIVYVLIICSVVLLFLSTILTVLGNPEPFSYARKFIPGLRPWDAISLISGVIVWVIPLYFGQKLLSSSQSHVVLLTALVVAGVAYTVLMLYEVRFSPQLHRMLYGFHQHSFAQHVRDGYRPMVFLPHGIHVGFFVFTAFMSAVIMGRIKQDKKWYIAAGWLLFMLLISRNLGAVSIAILMTGAFYLLPKFAQRLLIGVVCFFILTYPMMRLSPFSPTGPTLSLAQMVSVERSESLNFRFRNEDELLAKANQKPWTGWGGWGRNRIFNEDGRDVSVTDGLWIQRFGVSGWPGYFGFFGLICIPLMSVAWSAKKRKLPVETMGLALIMTGNLIYIVPNNVMSPIGWLITGAIAGAMYRGNTVTSEVREPAGPKHSTYSRFRPPEQMALSSASDA